MLHAELRSLPRRNNVRRRSQPSRELKLRLGLFGAEPWSERIRERVELELGIEAFDVYGLTSFAVQEFLSNAVLTMVFMFGKIIS